MIIANLDIEGVAFFPAKTEAPPIVNPDAVLPLTVSRQLFQAIARRNTQIVQRLGSIE
jgi:hypothetical protein